MQGVETFTGSNFTEADVQYFDGSSWQHWTETVTMSVSLGFETGSLSSDWTTANNNFRIESSPTHSGSYSGGSWSNGTIDATWSPLDSPQELDSFEFYWQETSSQTGHVVILEDSNGNEIMESGNENPQWYLNDGSGGRWQVNDGNGNYDDWIYNQFTFDWANGNYDYHLENMSTGLTETGTQSMDNANAVDHFRFTGDGYGSADVVVFDDLIYEYTTTQNL